MKKKAIMLALIEALTIEREARAKVRADQINRALENQRRDLVKEWATDPPYGIICGVRKLIEEGKLRPPAGWPTPTERHPVLRVRVTFTDKLTELDTPATYFLRRLANCLKGLDGYTVMLHGHCSNSGNYHDDLKVSRDRSESVECFLRSHGVRRITSRNYGNQRPLDGDPDADERVDVNVFGLGETAAKGVLEAFPVAGYFEIEEYRSVRS